ncbi:MAG TPA: hypothetical protein VE981_01405 [Planctomycetota bacterium]|nr:hypothetical protein [Planctomycetota bacterium]
MNRSRLLLLLLCQAPGLCLTACSSSLIADYEVLPVPAGRDLYAVGRPWSVDYKGPVGVGAPKWGTADGVESLKSSTPKNQAELSLKVPLLKWIGGSLGFTESELPSLDGADFKHEFLEDESKLISPRPLLWEIITATDITFTCNKTSTASLDVTVAAGKLTGAVSGGGEGGDIGVTLKSEIERKYTVTSKKRLVVAIRVAVSEAEAKSVRRPLNLTEAMYDKVQDAGPFGYRFVVRKADPVRKTAVIDIANPQFQQWTGMKAEITRDAPSCQNSRRNAIPHPDDPVRDPDFIWDNLTLIWNGDLSACEMLVDRQYQMLRSVKSGLDTK